MGKFEGNVLIKMYGNVKIACCFETCRQSSLYINYLFQWRTATQGLKCVTDVIDLWSQEMMTYLNLSHSINSCKIIIFFYSKTVFENCKNNCIVTVTESVYSIWKNQNFFSLNNNTSDIEIYIYYYLIFRSAKYTLSCSKIIGLQTLKLKTLNRSVSKLESATARFGFLSKDSSLVCTPFNRANVTPPICYLYIIIYNL